MPIANINITPVPFSTQRSDLIVSPDCSEWSSSGRVTSLAFLRYFFLGFDQCISQFG